MVVQFFVMAHAFIGMIAGFAALWTAVELLNASEANRRRIVIASTVCAVFTWLVYLWGGHVYLLFYAPHEAQILAGAWPWAHTFFMEFKEHAFFMVLLLATYLPMVARRPDLLTARGVRRLALSVAVTVFLLSLTMEGAGAVIDRAIRLGLPGGA